MRRQLSQRVARRLAVRAPAQRRSERTRGPATDQAGEVTALAGLSPALTRARPARRLQCIQHLLQFGRQRGAVADLGAARPGEAAAVGMQEHALESKLAHGGVEFLTAVLFVTGNRM